MKKSQQKQSHQQQQSNSNSKKTNNHETNTSKRNSTSTTSSKNENNDNTYHMIGVSLEKSEVYRYELMEYIVKKRITNLEYIRKIHDVESSKGQVFWMNVVKISVDDLIRFHQNHDMKQFQKRLQHWFCLGMSITPLLQLSNGSAFVRGLAQLLEEFEYHYSNVAVQGMKMLKVFSKPSEEEKAVKPSINKIGNQVIYEFLRTPNLPSELDYGIVVVTLCDILILVYRKLIGVTNITVAVSERILKIDAKFKHHFFGLISREIATVAEQTLKNKFCLLETLLTTPSSSLSNLISSSNPPPASPSFLSTSHPTP